MALSMGGGSLINAIMGQYGSAQRQRQQQQDQLMQMMQRGFVQTDQAQQARQGESLLSQLLAPPERMRAQDFEMAPWNPARIAEEERKSRAQIEKDRQAYQTSKMETQNKFTEEQNSLNRKHEIELQGAKDEAAKERVKQKHELDKLLQEIKQTDALAVAAAKHNEGPDEWRKIADTVFMMDEKIAEIKGSKNWWEDNAQQDRRIKEITRARDALWAKLPDEFKQPQKELDDILDEKIHNEGITGESMRPDHRGLPPGLFPYEPLNPLLTPPVRLPGQASPGRIGARQQSSTGWNQFPSVLAGTQYGRN
tara:strand:- start:13 stop:939 length:927 start_codon:yes stop_codon:yes gene_type:complete